MKSLITDFDKMIDSMCEREILDPEHLRGMFYKSLSYRDLLEILCNFINARHLAEDCREFQDIGRFLLENKALNEELQKEREDLLQCRNELLQARNDLLKARSKMLDHQRHIVKLEGKVSQLQSTVCRLENAADYTCCKNPA